MHYRSDTPACPHANKTSPHNASPSNDELTAKHVELSIGGSVHDPLDPVVGAPPASRLVKEPGLRFRRSWRRVHEVRG